MDNGKASDYFSFQGNYFYYESSNLLVNFENKSMGAECRFRTELNIELILFENADGQITIIITGSDIIDSILCNFLN